MMGDSQAVKNTCTASAGSKGFCFYKSTNGIKRHLMVDTLGFPFFTLCTPANVSDDAGLILMLTANIDYFKSKPVNNSQNHDFVRQRLSSRQTDRSVEGDISADHDEGAV